MKFLKSHIGVIFPLLILLFSIEFSIMVGRIVDDYESKMGKDYNIIVVSEKELKKADLKEAINTFDDIEELDTSEVINRLKNDISIKNLTLLKNTLPKFYSIKLTSFPSASYLNKIKNDLNKFEGVKKVETFSNTYDKIYKLLVMFKNISEYFTALVALMGIILIFKQMRIWIYEHRQRIEIMSYLGAPYWLKSAMLYKLALIDSVIATFLVCIFYMLILNLDSLQVAVVGVGFDIPNLNLLGDGFILFVASILASIISVSLVMLNSREVK